MLKKIQLTTLACALALAPSTAALAEYEKVCFDLKAAGYVASFIIAFGQRDNQNGLDPHWNRQNARDQEAIGRIHAHQHRCFNLADVGARPGDRLRFYVRAHGGKTVECQPQDRYRDIHQGFWLQPDGPRQGVLTFRENGGTTLHHKCHRSGGELRMHSECNATLDGMSNAGCGHWRPNLTDDVLHRIVRDRGGYGMLGSALRRGADVNKTLHGGGFGNGNTALHIAAWLGHADYAEELIRANANVNARNADGFTPLGLAAAQNHRDLATMRAILDGGANANYAAFNGSFPLYQAAEHGRPDMVRLLVENGARMNALHGGNGESALEAAKRGDKRQVTKYLRNIGAREEVYDGIVYDIVAEDRGVRRMRDAISDGADVNAVGENGKTALHVAAERDLRNYVSELIKAKTLEADLTDDHGRTALLAAVDTNAPSASVVRSLINKKADTSVSDSNGNFPLYVAAQNGRTDLVQLIGFARGIDINQRHTQTDLTTLGLVRQLSETDPNPTRFSEILSFLERRNARL